MFLKDSKPALPIAGRGFYKSTRAVDRPWLIFEPRVASIPGAFLARESGGTPHIPVLLQHVAETGPFPAGRRPSRQPAPFSWQELCTLIRYLFCIFSISEPDPMNYERQF
jgi:hypothetical protein